jgi:hypothetical protein
MTICKFISLRDKEKIETVLKSHFLAERIEKEVCFRLYHLRDFFVELRCDADKKVIYGMKPFATKQSLEPYLKNISIAEIACLLKAS